MFLGLFERSVLSRESSVLKDPLVMSFYISFRFTMKVMNVRR